LKVALRWLDMVAYLVFLGFVLLTGVRITLWYAGLALSFASALFWFAARWQLGASFSVQAEARQLVTSGLYSKFRHPVYVFSTAAWVGVLVALLGVQGVVIGLIVVVVQILRARREDRVLAQAFGSEYVAYRASTWF